MSTGIWSPSQDKAAAENAVGVAEIAYQSLWSVVEERLAGLPDSDEKQAIRNSAFQLEQTVDSFIDGQTAGLVAQLEKERGEAVLAIRRLQVEVVAFNNRSKFLETEMAKVDSENINGQSYNVRAAHNAKPSARFGLSHEVEEWERWVKAEEAKMQKLQDVLSTHKIEYAEVNRELNNKMQEFNAAQAKEAALWKRIQLLKKSPEVLKEKIKSEISKVEHRKAELNAALLALGAGSLEAAGVGFAG
jgi:chromosome segregation ATPase